MPRLQWHHRQALAPLQLRRRGPRQLPHTGLRAAAFFAGQLLTEEDLRPCRTMCQQEPAAQPAFMVTAWCGLQVTCNPVVAARLSCSRHAVDCCGNDLVLSKIEPTQSPWCDLRRNLLGGYDRGDPCRPEAQRRQARRHAEGRPRAITASTRYSEEVRAGGAADAIDELLRSCRLRAHARPRRRALRDALPGRDAAPDSFFGRVLTCPSDLTRRVIVRGIAQAGRKVPPNDFEAAGKRCSTTRRGAVH